MSFSEVHYVLQYVPYWLEPYIEPTPGRWVCGLGGTAGALSLCPLLLIVASLLAGEPEGCKRLDLGRGGKRDGELTLDSELALWLGPALSQGFRGADIVCSIHEHGELLLSTSTNDGIVKPSKMASWTVTQAPIVTKSARVTSRERCYPRPIGTEPRVYGQISEVAHVSQQLLHKMTNREHWRGLPF